MASEFYNGPFVENYPGKHSSRGERVSSAGSARNANTLGYGVAEMAGALSGYPRLAAFLDSDMNFMIYRRFGFLQARVLLNKQDEIRQAALELDELDNLDQEYRLGIEMNSISEDSQDKRREFLRLLGQKLSEYDSLFLCARNIQQVSILESKDYGTVGQWLSNATNIPKLDQEDDIRWPAYSAEVKAMILDAGSNNWLDYKISDILEREPFRGRSASSPRIRSWWDWRGRRLDRQRGEQQAAVEEDTEQSIIRVPRMSLKEKSANYLLKLVSVLVYSVNVTGAIGYIMLVNTPSYRESPSWEILWKTCLISWAITTGILLVHGLFFGKTSTEWYAKRIILIGIGFFSIIAFALQKLAVNVTSGALLGFSLSIAFIHYFSHVLL